MYQSDPRPIRTKRASHRKIKALQAWKGGREGRHFTTAVEVDVAVAVVVLLVVQGSELTRDGWLHRAFVQRLQLLVASDGGGGGAPPQAGMSTW
jgi:hypothetical protein